MFLWILYNLNLKHRLNGYFYIFDDETLEVVVWETKTKPMGLSFIFYFVLSSPIFGLFIYRSYMYMMMKTKNPDKQDQHRLLNSGQLSKFPTLDVPSFLRSNNECSCWTYSRYSNYMNINQYYDKRSVFWNFLNTILDFDWFSLKKRTQTQPIVDSFE